jgi:subtilase family serine protease
MARTRPVSAIVGATAVIGMMISGASGVASAAPRPVDALLVGSAVPFASHGAIIGDVAASKQLTIQVWLQPRTAAAERYATAVSTPGSGLFHHYLSPASYTARFSATRGQEQKVAAWLRSQGFTSVQAGAGRSYVRATAPASAIERAFHTQLQLYRSSAAVNAGPYALRANDSAISVPRSLAGSVIGVTGIDNAAPKLPLDRLGNKPAVYSPATGAKLPVIRCSNYYGQHIVTGLPRQFGTTSFPTESCGMNATLFRAAYGANMVNTGKGQTIALVELGLTQDMFLTLQDYATANGLPAPSSERYSELSLGAGTQCGDFFDGEEQLDVESSYAVAPGASQLVIGGDSCNDGDFGLQGLFDADLAVLGSGSHPLATIASNSWEGDDESQPGYLTDIEHAYLLRAVAEGVGMYFSAGDGSGVAAPSSDPYATAVGGTTLGIGKTGNRLFETGWSTGESGLIDGAWQFLGEQAASGGGPSLLWKQPAYQKGVVPAALAAAPGNRGGLVRSVPDISADADPFTGFGLGTLSFPRNGFPDYSESDIGGTSLASPLVAGLVADAQQGERSSFGFLNPVFYKLVGTSAVNDTLPITSETPVLYRGTACGAAQCGFTALTTFDDQSYNMEGYAGQVTLKGYDNMTGVGTPNGQAFIAALRKLAQ